MHMFVGSNRPQGRANKALDSTSARKSWQFAQLFMLTAVLSTACTATSGAKPQTPPSAPGRECLLAAQAPAQLSASAPSSIEVKHLLVSHRQSNGLKRSERSRELEIGSRPSSTTPTTAEVSKEILGASKPKTPSQNFRMSPSA